MTRRLSLAPTPAFALFLLAGCGGEQPEAGGEEFASPPEGAVVEIPTTTASEEALAHFDQGHEAADVGRFQDANEHYRMAVEADPTCAICYLNVAFTGGSLDEFRTNLGLASDNAAGASEGEQLTIEIAEKGFENDPQAQLELAYQLVEMYPSSPRALLTLAGIQTSLNDHAAARATLTRAIELSPDFAPAYTQLGLSYMFQEPIDLARSQEYMRKTVDLAPNERIPYDFLGDAYRAQGLLEQAADAYTRSAELDLEDGSALQQRGHVHSILGNYDEARADYDAAIALSDDAAISSFAIYRAFTHVHEGNAQEAIDELKEIRQKIDGEEWNIRQDQRTGQKIFALLSIAQIALHHGMLAEAEAAIGEVGALMRQQAQAVGTEEFARGQESQIAYWEGVLAARQGDYAAAMAKAAEFGTIVEADNSPRKMEPAHDLMGQIALLQGNCEEAVTHFQQADLTVPYTMYQIGQAHECAGNTEEAMSHYRRIAEYNFNAVGFALVKEEAAAKLEG